MVIQGLQKSGKPWIPVAGSLISLPRLMVPAEPDESPAGGLDFAFHPADRGGTLTLPARELFAWLQVERLVLEIPPLGEPLAPDTPAERFQRRRTHVQAAAFHLSEPGLHHLVEQRMHALAPLGVEELAVRCRDGCVALAGRVRDGSHAAEITFRLHLIGDGSAIHLLVDRPRIIGYLPVPAPLLAHRILMALAGALEAPEDLPGAAGVAAGASGVAAPGTSGVAAPGALGGAASGASPGAASGVSGGAASGQAGAGGASPEAPELASEPPIRPRVIGLGQLAVEPLAAFLWTTLPPAGWRLPGTGRVSLARVQVVAGRIELAYEAPAQNGDGEPDAAASAGEATLALAQALHRVREGDEALRTGDLETALAAYRGRFATDGPGALALDRLLALCAARPVLFEEGTALAGELLARTPGLEVAHAALASVAMARGQTREAAERFAHLATTAAAAGDQDTATCAALAGARILRMLEPAAATPLYEQVLAHRPDHDEARRVLIERYTEEQRWLELAEMLRLRIADAATPAQEVRDRVQRARILYQHQGQTQPQSQDAVATAREEAVATAREEIDLALKIDPDHIPALELRATLAREAGDEAAYLQALGQLAPRNAARGNTRAAAEAWTQAGMLHERRGEDREAEACYRQALSVAPADAMALRGTAMIAGQRGDHATAARTWAQLVRTSDAEPAVLAQYRLELGRSLLAVGNDAGAEEPLRQASAQGGDAVAAEAHCLIADIRRSRQDSRGAVAELDAAIVSLSRAADRYFAEAHARIQAAEAAADGQAGAAGRAGAAGQAGAALGGGPHGEPDDGQAGTRFLTRAAHLARERALLLEELGRADAARADYHRAHSLARKVDAITARDNARSLIRPDRVRGSVEAQRRWIDALIKGGATGGERIELQLARAELRCRTLLDRPAGATGEVTPADTGLSPDDIQEALIDLDEVLAAGPSNVQRALALVLQAQLRGAAGDTAGRARTLAERAALVVAPLDRAEAEAAAARAWLSADDSTAARAALDRALRCLDRMPPGHGPAAVRRRILALLAEAAWHRRAWDMLIHAGEPLVNDLAVAATERARHAHRLGMAREAVGDMARAIQAFEAALAVPDVTGEQRTESWRALARTHEHAGNPREAAGIFEMLARDRSAAASSRDRADAWHRAGDLWRRQGNAEEAERCFEAALHHAPDHLPSLDALESMVRIQGDDLRMATILQSKVSATQGHPERQTALLLRLGELQAKRLGQHEEAAETYRCALGLSPSCRPALMALAELEREAGHLRAAAEAYERLAHLLPAETAHEDPSLLDARAAAAEVLIELVSELPDALVAGDPQQTLDRVQTALAAIHASATAASAASDREQDQAGGAGGPGDMGDGARRDSASTARISWSQEVTAEGAPPDVVLQPDEALAALDDEDSLRERADLAAASGDHEEYARCLRALIARIPVGTQSGRLRNRGRRAELLLELADLYYDRLGDRARAREIMREAAGAYGPGSRHDATLRMLASEAAADGADADAVDAYEAIEPERRTAADYLSMAISVQRMSDNARAIEILEQAQERALLSDRGAVMLFGLRQEQRLAAEQSAAPAARTAGGPNGAAAVNDTGSESAGDVAGEAAGDMAGDAAGDMGSDAAGDMGDHGPAGTTAEIGLRPRRILDTIPNEVPPRTAAARRRKRFEGTRLGVIPAGGRTLPMPGPSRPPGNRVGAAPGQQTAGHPQQAAGHPGQQAAGHPAPVPAPQLVIPAAAQQRGVAGRAGQLAPPAISPRMLAPSQTVGTPQRPPKTTQLGYSPHRNSRATLTYPGVELDIRKLEAAAFTIQDPAHAAELLGRSLALRTGRLSRHGHLLDDDAAAVLGRLRDLARRSGQHRLLAQGLETAAAVADPETKGTLLHEAGCLQRDQLGDETAAADLFMRAIEAAPASAYVLRDADALLRRRGEGRRLVEAYELYLGTVDGRERARPLYELGRLYRDVLHEPGLAASYFARAHQADSELVEVWLPLANARFAGDDLSGARQLYERMLERGAPDADTREWILSRLAAMGDTPAPQPQNTLGRIRLRPVRRPAGGQPGGLAGHRAGNRGPGRADGPAVHHRDGVDGGDRGDAGGARVDESLRRAEAFEARGQRDAAIAHYRTAAERAPGDVRPLDGLDRLFRAQGDLDGLADLLGDLVAGARDARVRAALWFRRARLYRDDLFREPEAYQCLKHAHAEDPEDSVVANALRHIAMARGDWALAADLLRREIDNASNTREAGALNLELALIYDEKLLDAEQARVHYEKALALDPAIPAVPRPLARLYELSGRHADAARMNEIAAQHARDDSQRSRLLYRAAAAAERAADLDNARRLYHLAALAAPEGEDASASQRALLRLDDNSGASRTQLLELALRDAGSDEQRIELLRQLLDRATTAGDLDAADRHARALLQVDGADLAAYLVLKSRAEATKNWNALASLLNARAVSLSDPGERAAVYYDLGRLQQTHLGDAASAATAFEKALVADPTHPAALEALADLAYQRQDWSRARQIYARMRPETTSLSADAIAYRRGVIADALGHEREALEAFTLAVALLPSNKQALEAMHDLALRAGDLDQAIEASQALLDLLPPDDVQAITGARLRLAELCAQAGRVDEAIEYDEMVLSEEPGAQPALRALVELYVRKGDFASAARTLRRLITATAGPAQRAALLFRLGEMYRIHLRDPEQAADAYLKGIDLDPTHVPTLRRLLDHYWREDDPVELLEIVDALAEQDALLDEQTGDGPLIHALVVVAAGGNVQLARQLIEWLDDRLAEDILDALAETTGRQSGALSVQALASAVSLICELTPAVRLADIADGLAARGDEMQALVQALRDEDTAA